jgi:hypothetical protein
MSHGTHAAQADLFVAQPPARWAGGVMTPTPVARARAVALAADIKRAEQCHELRRLEPIAMLVGAGRAEFTMADVRDEAERVGLLTGHEGRPNPGTGRLEQPRALAFLGGLLPGLARIGFVAKVTDAKGRTVYDTSDRKRANGNKQALWRVTERGAIACTAAQGDPIRLRDYITAYRESGVPRT